MDMAAMNWMGINAQNETPFIVLLVCWFFLNIPLYNQLSVLGMEAMAREKFDDKHHLMIYF